MIIKLEGGNGSDAILTIKGTGQVEEDKLIEKWYDQIIKHMNKLNLK